MKAVLFKEDGSIIGQMLVNDDVTNLEHNVVCYDEEKYVGREVIGFDFQESKLIFTNGFKNNEEVLQDKILELELTVDQLLLESLEV